MNLSIQQQRICTNLSSQGWAVVDDFLTPELIAQLAVDCEQQYQLGKLRPAGVGREQQFAVLDSVRGDKIRWIEDGVTATTDAYLTQMQQLRELLNKQLFLGLENNENHYAVYPPGAFYRKHLDRFRDNDSRTISSILYLNQDWQPEHGGQLRLHIEEQPYDIAPLWNRLVLFVSADIWHEVLPTTAERYSLTGWFKRRN